MILLVAMALGAEPIDVVLRRTASAPLAPERHLELALALAERPERRDEAVAALLTLLDDPELGASAGAALAEVVLEAEFRPAWASAYAALAEVGPEAITAAIWHARAELGDPAAASLERLERLQAQHPDHREARRALTLARLEAGDAEGALALLGDATDAGPVAGAAWLALDRYSEARKRLRPGTGETCIETGLPAACAETISGLGFPGLAISELHEALYGAEGPRLSTPARREALWTLAGLYKASDRPEQAAEALHEALQIAPDDTALRRALALTLIDAGEPDEALQLADRSDEELVSTAYAVQLVLDLDSRDVAEARRTVEKALDLAPDHPLVRRAAAEVALEQERADDALAFAGPVLADDPSDRWTLGLVNRAEIELGRYDRALAHTRDALRATMDPGDWPLLVGDLSRLLVVEAEADKLDGRRYDALEGYLLARTLDPASVGILLGYGGALWELGSEDAAFLVFSAAIATAPGNREALLSLARILATQGRDEEAAQLIARSGFGGLDIDELKRELDLNAGMRRAKAIYEDGDGGAAAKAYEALLDEHPDHPQLLHALGNVLSSLGRLEEAAAVWERTRLVDPENPWAVLGEVNARIALADPVGARFALGQMPASDDLEVRRELQAAKRRLVMAEANQMAAEGRTKAAFARYERLFETDAEDPWVLIGLGGLYGQHWQHGVAQAFFEEALGVDPANIVAREGRVRSLAARRVWDPAEEAARELQYRAPSDAHRDLAESIALRRIVARADAARIAGEPRRALAMLEPVTQRMPNNPVLLAAVAGALLDLGEHEQAWDIASAALDIAAAEDAALGALLGAGFHLGRLAEVEQRFDEAVSAGAGSWVSDTSGLVELAKALREAEAYHAAGRRDDAEQTVLEAERHIAVSTVDQHVLVGGTWLTLGQPRPARQHFELALALDDEDPGAMLGMASAVEGEGRPDLAEAMLEEAWTASGDARVGVELGRLQSRRGHHQQAEHTLTRLRAATFDTQVVVIELPQPAPLPVLELASGRRPYDNGPPLLTPVASSPPDLDELAEDLAYETWSGQVSPVWIRRPGTAGRTQMQALITPVAAELYLSDTFRLDLEVAPVWAGDGQNNAVGAAAAAGLATPDYAALRGNAWLGVSPIVGAPNPYLTWYGEVTGAPGRGLEFALDLGRAPATDSVMSWFGAPTGNDWMGRVRDTWFSGRVSHAGDEGGRRGVQGRVGWATGLLMEPVSWQQVLGWWHGPVLEGEAASLRLGAEGNLLSHDRVVADFLPGEGGFFSPEQFYELRGWAEGRYSRDPERWGVCAEAGIGPQWLVGPDTATLDGGQWLGWHAGAVARWELDGLWGLDARYIHQGSFGAWARDVTLVRLRYGRPDSAMSSPGPTLSSPTHGPPLRYPGHCDARLP